MNPERFQIEKLEDRIAPSFVLVGQPADAGASPPGPRGDGTIGPSVFTHPTLDAWEAHFNSPVLDNGGT